MKYRYSKRYGHGNCISIEPIPAVGKEATQFRVQVRQIAIELFGRGASTALVVTEVAGGVLFQDIYLGKNKKRAQAVMGVWRARHK